MRRRGGARRRAYCRLVHRALSKTAHQMSPLLTCGLMFSLCRESAVVLSVLSPNRQL